jgi:hypothetical protein
MACLAVTALIFIAYYYLFATASPTTPSRNLLSAFVMGCAQVVMTELLLGLGQLLQLSYLIVTNVALAGLVLLFARRRGTISIVSMLKADISICRRALADSADIFTISIGILVILTYGWISAAAYYLPPRGIDDLVYHLATIFEYIQSHEIKLLPVALRYQYAFPENAELLFMWPTIFAGNQRLVDGLNVPFVLVSILTVHALLRHFGISRRDALFAALLYALSPVVIMQAGVNYVDIIVALFCLLSLYFALQFHGSGSIASLYAAGVATGLMLGMKYTALLLALPLQFLILPGLFRIKRRHAAGYLGAILLLCGWWYGRNLAVFLDPFYPLNFLGFLLGKPGGGGIFSNIRVNLSHWVSQQLAGDIGLGGCDGGFGLVFWGLGFSSWLYYGTYALFHPRESGMGRLVSLAYLPIGFLLLLSVHEAEVPYMGRLAIFVVAIGLYSLCATMKILADTRCSAILKSTCIILSLLNASLLTVSIKPHFNLGPVIQDRLRQQYPSDFKYFSPAKRTARSQQGLVCEALDHITRSDNTGLYCHLISDPFLYFPSSVYGSRLQNRLAYTHPPVRGAIEAYVYTYYPGLRNMAVDASTSSYDIIADSRYVVAAHWDYGCLILRRDIFEKPEKQRLLAGYYKQTWPEAVTAARQVSPLLTEEIPIITSSQIGYGLRCLYTGKRRMGRVITTPRTLEELAASRLKIRRGYTIGKPLAGYEAHKVGQVVYANEGLDVYLNRKP